MTEQKSIWRILTRWYWLDGKRIKHKIFFYYDLAISVAAVVVYAFANYQFHADISQLYSTLFPSLSTALAFIIASLPVLLAILDKPILANIREEYGEMIIWVYRHSCLAIFSSIVLLGLGILDLDGISSYPIYKILRLVYQDIVILSTSISTLAIRRCFYLLFKCADKIMKEK